MFTSCKDYDDDIKNLQTQIDKAALKADLDALSARLATVENTANAAKSTAETALAKANTNATEIAAVKKTAEDAAAAAADALTKVARAQSTAEAAQAAADKAQAAADAAKAVADAAATKTYADEIKAIADAAQAAANAAQATADKKADKTYADEIKAVADAAKALAEKAATKDELAAAKTELTNLANAAQATADAAKALAEAAATKTELNDAKTELKNYADAVKEQALVEAAAAAKAYTDEKTGEINRALENYATNAALETLSGKLDEEVSKLNETLAGLTEADFREVKVIVDNFTDILDEIFTMVTSVELIATYTGNSSILSDGHTYPMGSFVDGDFQNQIMNFIFGKQATDEKFGDKEDLYKDADEIKEYSTENDINNKTALLIRVNPTNAQFTKDQVKFFDSMGNSLDEIVEVGDPTPYEGLLTRITRGAAEKQATGLWVVPVKVKENTAKDDFNGVTIANYAEKEKKGDKFNPEYKLYAIAINNNSMENAADRFVASTYDLAAEFTDFVPTTSLYYDIDENSVGKYHNRWYNAPRDGVTGYIQSYDQYAAYTTKNPEQRWMRQGDKGWKKEMVIPTGKAQDNTFNDSEDYRFSKPYYVAEVGQTMTLELPDRLKSKIEWWYVAFDYELNAVESAPSEWEAWKSYEANIEGLHKMTAGVDKIELTVNAEEAKGDVIGFRVFAVNYDGTLADPDGKAFYVKCGEIPTVTVQANGEFTAKQQSAGVTTGINSGIAKIEYPKDDEGKEIRFESLPLDKNSGTQTLYQENDPTKPNYAKIRSNYILIGWELLKDKDTRATDWKDINYIKITVDGNYLSNILDGATLDLGTLVSRTITDANNRQKYEVTATATKIMPTETKDVTWKSGYEYAENIYVIPEKNSLLNPSWDKSAKLFRWNGGSNLRSASTRADVALWVGDAAKTGSRQIKDYIASGLINSSDYQHKFVFAGLPTTLSKDNAPKAYEYVTTPDAYATAVRAGNTVIDVLPDAIGNSYDYTMYYVYKNISATNEIKNGQIIWSDDRDYPVEVWTKKTNFKDALDLLTYKYENPYTDKDGKAQKSSQLYLPWSAVSGYRSSRLLQKISVNSDGSSNYQYVSGDLVNYLVATMSDGNKVLADNAGLTYSTFVRPRYIFDNPATANVEENDIDIKISGNIATYIELVDNSTTGNLRVRRIASSAEPYEHKDGKITLTGYDVFGKPHSWEISVTLLFNE